MGQLEVFVIEGRNLTQKDEFSENDAFIKIYLDDKNQTQKTKVIHNSNNPIWNQSFVFNHLKGQDILHVDVYDEDTIKNDKIGSIQINLKHVYDQGLLQYGIYKFYSEFFFRKQTIGHIDNWFIIQDDFGVKPHGEIHLILHYEKLQI